MIRISIKKLNPLAKIPKQANISDAGFDLYPVVSYWIKSGERNIVKIGIAISIPDGYYGRIAPRSGLSVKFGLQVLAGVIDSGYLGEIGVVIYNSGNEDYIVSPNQAIAQLIIEKCHAVDWVETDDLEKTERAEKGFGSSDSKSP